MSTIHFILQGKGGVGKSLVSSLLYQFIQEQELPIFAVDTDPVNSTLGGYEELDVQILNIMDGDDIDQRRFDDLMEIILAQPEDGHVIIDNGASSFIPLCSYFKENSALAMLADNGNTILLHTVITGGQAIGDTVAGMVALAQSFPDAPLVIWLNRYFGDIAMEGKSFEEFAVFKEYSAQFKSIIKIPQRKQSTFGKDLEDLFSRRETFRAAIASDLPIMVRQRLKTFWNEMQEEIDKAQLLREGA